MLTSRPTTTRGDRRQRRNLLTAQKDLDSYDIYGTKVIVPHCNPISLNNQIDHEQHGVYDAATGQNWNRLFKVPGGPPGDRLADEHQ